MFTRYLIRSNMRTNISRRNRIIKRFYFNNPNNSNNSLYSVVFLGSLYELFVTDENMNDNRLFWYTSVVVAYFCIVL